ncbi:MAG TPA: DUF4272 domain-containing protein [Gemmataceae bacterium]|nr:DUF4272 domain-containing protein [Gemmataceae bacterium]
MLSTKAWAKSLGISVESTPPTIEGYSKRCPRSARQIAIRAVILQGVVAVAAGVDPEPIVEWFHDERIWRNVTPGEKAFLKTTSCAEEQCNKFAWHQEAEWTLLWVIGKVESLGLPTHQCDTRKLVDEIIPALGSDIGPFVASAKVREPGVLLAEGDRTYDLWCHALKAQRNGKLPADLNLTVLYERRYAFEWLDGIQEWDDVRCDA